jgi:hypothetical protein
MVTQVNSQRVSASRRGTRLYMDAPGPIPTKHSQSSPAPPKVGRRHARLSHSRRAVSYGEYQLAKIGHGGRAELWWGGG